MFDWSQISRWIKNVGNFFLTEQPVEVPNNYATSRKLKSVDDRKQGEQCTSL